jgi:hypothetical protein
MDQCCHNEWEKIFNFHCAGITRIDYKSMVKWGNFISLSLYNEIASSSPA